jgi:hypothetical protein
MLKKSSMLLVVVLAVLFLFTTSWADAVKYFSQDSVIYGRTYSDWSAAWQQWADSMPWDNHPLFDTAADCSEGQSGPVWFLGGKFCPSDADPGECPGPDEPFERSCTVPVGKALYFPILNYACLDVEAEKGYCEDAGPYITEIRSVVGGGIDLASDLQVTVDGKKIKGNLKEKFRVQSNVYTASLPDNNILNGIGYNDIVAGTYWGVDDGFYVMLKPLSRGEHTINFKGGFPDFGFYLDVTYRLTVK